MRFVVAMAVLMAFTGCVTSDDEAKATATKAGFTNVKTGGTSLFACSEDDKYGRDFTATNFQGQEVEGVVCCGFWFKNCTIRY